MSVGFDQWDLVSLTERLYPGLYSRTVHDLRAKTDIVAYRYI
ncbi:hypothetical protein ABH944_005748 [Caballeronia udeis]|uniref:Uncharacterized protein n=1 Tax=Caballeronia udeis TaxID=1232866 RepID=A0ABW8MQD5_9BURK